MPGVLTVEALAQTGAVAILSKEENKGKIAYFGGIQKCRFKGKVVPGDKVRLETRIIRQKGPLGVGEAAVSYTHLDVYKRQSLYSLRSAKGYRRRGCGLF